MTTFKVGDYVRIDIPTNVWSQTHDICGVYFGTLEDALLVGHQNVRYPLSCKIDGRYITFTNKGEFKIGNGVWLSHAYGVLFEEEQ